MAFEFRLPDIGEGVVEGEVVRWFVKAGDEVKEDQPMVEVMTDKATVEISSPKAGRITSIEVPDGKIAKVGQVLVRMELGAGAAAQTAAEPTARAEEIQQANGAAAGKVVPMPSPEGGPSGKVLATPATRKLARDLGVDLRRVTPTGSGGRITAEDVRSSAGQGAFGGAAAVAKEAGSIRLEPADLHAPLATPSVVAPAHDERIPFRGVRKKIAENMARSKRTAAHYTYVEEVDVTELVQLRARAKARAEERGTKLSFLPFIMKAVVAGLKKFPILNSTLDEAHGEIVLHKQYHIGIAAASQQGLVVPVVRNADQKSIFQLAREIEDVTQRAKEGRAHRDELTGSTFTISSLGPLGGVMATPIVNFPEVAVLGVHKIKQAPVVRDGQIVIRDVCNYSISLDHRVVDGYEGALFLSHVLSLLADPTMLFMELV